MKGVCIKNWIEKLKKKRGGVLFAISFLYFSLACIQRKRPFAALLSLSVLLCENFDIILCIYLDLCSRYSLLKDFRASLDLNIKRAIHTRKAGTLISFSPRIFIKKKKTDKSS